MRNMKATAASQIRSYNDVIRHRVYFGDQDPQAASVWTTDPIILFNKGQGDVTKNATTGADVTLKACDISLFGNGGLIPNAQDFVVMAIGIDIHGANVQGNVEFSDDQITQIDVNPVQGVNPYPLINQIRSQGVFQLQRNSTELLEEGNVADYPCGLATSGWGSDGSQEFAEDGTPAGNLNGFIYAANGMAFRPLTVWQKLDSLDQFQGSFTMARPLLLTGTGIVGYVDFLLVGQAGVNRQSTQLIQNFSN